MCFEITCVVHISSRSIHLKSFEIIGIVHCLSQPVSQERLVIIRLVHFRAIMCTKRMIASLSREIGWLEMCPIHMIPKHMKVYLTSKLYHLIVPSVALLNLTCVHKLWVIIMRHNDDFWVTVKFLDDVITDRPTTVWRI